MILDFFCFGELMQRRRWNRYVVVKSVERQIDSYAVDESYIGEEF